LFFYAEDRRRETHTTRQVLFFIQKKEEEKHTLGPDKYDYNYRRKKKRSTHQNTSVFMKLEDRR
jgi:hypothetical protein